MQLDTGLLQITKNNDIQNDKANVQKYKKKCKHMYNCNML